MDKSDICRRYKWSSSATNLLVSIWCHDLVQNQLNMSPRNQPIWESVARYMSRKGFSVTGLQCKTRIKNMLCNYNEAVRRNDPSIIKPYFDIFKKVLGSKNSKKKDQKSTKVRKKKISIDTDEENENSLHSDSLTIDQSDSQNFDISDYQMEFLDVSNPDSQTSDMLNGNEVIAELKKVIVEAIDSQTKAITNVIQIQSQMVERLLTAEREKIENIMALERENRRELETRLDKLLSRLEANIPQVTYMSTLIEENDLQRMTHTENDC